MILPPSATNQTPALPRLRAVPTERRVPRPSGVVAIVLALLAGIAAPAVAEPVPMLVEDLHPAADQTASLPVAEILLLGGQVLAAGDTLQEWDAGLGELVEVAPVANPFLLFLSPQPGEAIFRGGPDGTLWKTDGTGPGTMEISTVEVDDGFLAGGSWAFFEGTDAAGGTELWRTDGTAGGTVRVVDLAPDAASSNPEILDVVFGVEGQPFVFFAADDGSGIGTELWRTNEFATDAVLVGDFNSAGSSFPTCSPPIDRLIGCPKISFQSGPILIEMDDVDLGSPGDIGTELWAVDLLGVELVQDINPGPGSSYSDYFAELVPGVLMFSAETADEGGELWRTDGTDAGTMLVADLVPGPDSSYPYALAGLGGSVIFAADGEPPPTRGGGSIGEEVWVSDGTLGGTVLLDDFNSGPDSSSPFPYAIGNGLALLTVEVPADGGGTVDELWVTDGTLPGSTMLAELYGPQEGHDLVDQSGLLTFIGSTPAEGRELWETDLSAPGTSRRTAYGDRNETRLRTFFRFEQSSPVVFKAALEEVADNQGLRELWGSDGTLEGTRFLGSWDGDPLLELEALGLKFGSVDGGGTIGRELLLTDGTPEGTELVDVQTGPGSSAPAGFTEWNGKVYFQGDPDGFKGSELLVFDPEPPPEEGSGDPRVTLVKDINPFFPSSSPNGFAPLDDELFFFALTDLWKTDGTESGTVFVSDGGAPAGLWSLGELHPVTTSGGADVLVFAAVHPTLGEELWVTDGSDAGTTVLKDVNVGSGDSIDRSFGVYPVAFDGRLFYALDDGSGFLQLWETDGTAAGTQPVLSSPLPNDGRVTGLGPVLGTAGFYFTVYDTVNGGEPWFSDGTEGGTMLLADVAPGIESGGTGDAVAFDGRVWFVADDAPPTPFFLKNDVWSTDGTPAGTRFEFERYAEDPDNDQSLPASFMATDDLLFVQMDTVEYGTSLYALCTDCDYGDAMDDPYPTLVESVGARHPVGPLFLGALVDAEDDGQPFGGAQGDDDMDADDEDGVVFPAQLNPGFSSRFEVTASQAGLLDAWFDLDRDGTFGEGDERIFESTPVVAGAQELAFAVPAGIDLSGTTPHVLRFRLSSGGGLTPGAHAVDGEVEDYEVDFESSDPIFLDGFESGDTTAWSVP